MALRYRKAESESRTMPPRPFVRYADWLRERYGAACRRVPVDPGFPCPHRLDGSGGCSFCGPGGARAALLGATVPLAEQARRAAASAARRYGPSPLVLYFQAHTATNAAPCDIKRAIDEALGAAAFRALVVSTRPDCLDEERVALLASYRSDAFDVGIELGLQSSNDATLRRIGRGHDAATFARAAERCKSAGLRVCAHIVFGLPGEEDEDMLRSVAFAVSCGVGGLKLHDLNVVRGSALERVFRAGEFAGICRERHLDLCARALTLLPLSVVVERFVCEVPDAERVFPRRRVDKARFLRDLETRMLERGMQQGQASGWTF